MYLSHFKLSVSGWLMFSEGGEGLEAYQVLLEQKIDYENMTSSLTLQLLIEGTGLWYIKSCQTSPRIKQVPFRGCS